MSQATVFDCPAYTGRSMLVPRVERNIIMEESVEETEGTDNLK